MPAPNHTRRSRPDKIQIDEDPDFQARMWRIERIGWWGMAAVLVLAMGGLFGHGPLSRATLPLINPEHPAHGLLLDYERFGRAHSESRFEIGIPAGWPKEGTFNLWVSGEYLTDVEVLRITPDPSAQELAYNGVRYHFRLEEGPHTVVFRFQPQRPGLLSGSLRVNDGPPATFQQWLFP